MGLKWVCESRIPRDETRGPLNTYGSTLFLFTFTDSLSLQNIFCSSDNSACMEAKLSVC